MRDCGGSRLNPDALAVRIGQDTIGSVAARSVDAIHQWVRQLTLTDTEREMAQLIVDQLDARLSFLCDVGLGYLTLDRQTRTLSGGEAQRISLSNALGSHLVDTLYVLDEPSVGLHPRDTDRLLALLRRLRDAGNTVLVVEHDLAAIQQADFMLELGPGSGEHGGQVVHAGPVHDGADISHRDSISPARNASPSPASAGRPGRSGSGYGAPPCTTCRTWTWTFRWAHSRRSPASPARARAHCSMT